LVTQVGCRGNKIDLIDPIDKPDIRLYSQTEIWNGGDAPTWDSPDIWTYRWRMGDNKKIWPDNRILAQIQNLSPSGTALGTVVHCDISSYGIGTPRTRLSSQFVNIRPSSSVQVAFPLPQDIIDSGEFIGAHINAVLPGDINQANNHGSQVVRGSFSSEEGREQTVTFPIVNRLNRDVVLSFGAMPNNLSAVVTPQGAMLAPGEHITAELSLKVPDDVHGSNPNFERLDVTVISKENNALMDGLAYFIFVDD
jgi:hypothetical protein